MINKKITCIMCKEDKDSSEFHNCSRKKSGKQSYCKSCGKKKRKPYTPEQAKYYASYYSRKSRENPEEAKWKKQKVVYKKLGLYITREEYDMLLFNQGYRCAICKRHQSEFKNKLSLDHNHTTNRIRGFLCNLCNTGLGLFKDDILLLSESIEYLKNNP